MVQGKLSHFQSAMVAGVLCAAMTFFAPYLWYFGLLFSYFSSLPLYLVALKNGPKSLLTACGVALGLFLLGGSLHSTIFFMVITLLPALILGFLALQKDEGGHWYPIAFAISQLVLLAIGGLIVLGGLIALDFLPSWGSIVQWFIEAESTDIQITPETLPSLLEFLPGLASISWISMALFNFYLAYRIMDKKGLSLRPFPAPEDAKLPQNWDIGIVVGLLFQIMGSETVDFVAKNAVLLACIPVFITGCAVLYTWLKQFDNPRAWLVGYLVLTFLLVWPALFIVGLGILEPSLDLRKRMKKN